ncbi:MAG: carbohydrate kinase family protein [Crenarchaeota archaeon]|nr:carbohydrate kinase family protein [Thermoproteota archaeon]
MLRIGAVGHLNLDIYVKVDRLPEPDSRETCIEHYMSVGGAATNYSITLTKIGVESHLFVARGTDIIGDLLETTLLNMNVKIHSKKVEEHTGMVIVIVDRKGIKYMISIPGANKKLEITEQDLDIMRTLDHIHVVVSEPDVLMRVIQKMHDISSISLGYRTETARLGVRFLMSLDVRFRMMFLNRPEAEMLFNARSIDDIRRGCRFLIDEVSKCEEIVVTLGEEGSVIYGKGGLELRIPAFKVEAIDTTGAGDVFAAAYTFSRLVGLDHGDSGTLASAYAALKCTRRGASNVPEVEDVLRFLHDNGYHVLVDKVRNIFSRKVNL